ncbi:hypothetical protein IQ13_1099 [Lacibacter cauensis]|uniref:Glycosyltransferase RgtA/B/C/D-like domain-containing protein n=1 Tax=Lacibacter cauensis TaxID=510947 RepID=A0A562SP90_9BACT|nr:hypothetical protein [Lacibacter cauensis]TWI82993.1 hypothetical protein IQ13_1099 [Lacibacter cauensis]
MSTSKILTAVIVFAFVTRMLLLLAFPLQDTDYYMINAAAENLANGNGLGFQRSDPLDLSAIRFEGLRLWPPLPTILLSGIFKITGDINFANTLLLILCLSLLFYFLRVLFSALDLSLRVQILCFLIIGLNPEIIKQPGVSDLAAATFCIGSCSYAYSLVESQTKKKLPWLILYGGLLFLPSAFRYQYYPITILIPVLLFLIGHRYKKYTLKQQSLVLFIIEIISISIQEIFLYTYTYQPLSQSISMDNYGVYIYNLYFVYPFFLKTFLNFGYIENQFYTVFQITRNYYSLIVLALFVFWILMLAKELYKTNDILIRKKYIYLLTSILLLPFLTLITLSLFLNSRSGDPGGWTYVTEGRYYIVTSLLILAITAWFLKSKTTRPGYAFSKIAKKFFALILIYNLSSTIKFYVNFFNHNIPDKEKYHKMDRAKIDDLLTKNSLGNMQTILTYNDPFYAFFKYKPNIAVTLKIPILVRQNFYTTKNIQLLIVANKPMTNNDSLLILYSNAKHLATLNTTQLYIAEIKPTSIK